MREQQVQTAVVNEQTRLKRTNYFRKKKDILDGTIDFIFFLPQIAFAFCSPRIQSRVSGETRGSSSFFYINSRSRKCK